MSASSVSSASDSRSSASIAGRDDLDEDEDLLADNPVAVIRDRHQSVPLSRGLADDDIIVLLTPVVAPLIRAAPPSPSSFQPFSATDTHSFSPSFTEQSHYSDPFEPLGRALARRHGRVRHVPYTKASGITSTHVAFLRRAGVVIFVVSSPDSGQANLAALSGLILTQNPATLSTHSSLSVPASAPDSVPSLSPSLTSPLSKPMVLLVTSYPRFHHRSSLSPFPTIVAATDFSAPVLEAAAALLFGDYGPLLRSPSLFSTVSPPLLSPISTSFNSPFTGSLLSPVPPSRTPAAQPTHGSLANPLLDRHPLGSITVLPPAVDRSSRSQPSTQLTASWPVTEWNPRDGRLMHQMWCDALPAQFHMSSFLFAQALKRDGYSKHYVVREPRNPTAIIGFCATYTTYADSDPETLVGAIAALVVALTHRRRGVGSALHNVALSQLSRTRGVRRVILGSTYPRLLFGLPVAMADPETCSWLCRRGWPIPSPQHRSYASDWILSFDNLPQTLVLRPLPRFSFGPLPSDDPVALSNVVNVISAEARRQSHLGWYDQYARLASTSNASDVVTATEDDGTIVAAALTYLATPAHPAAVDLPLTRGLSVPGLLGGVTCICIQDPGPNSPYSRDAIMLRLLDACVVVLRKQGCVAMFLDGVHGGEDGFLSLGFEEWARYLKIWRDV